MKTSVCVLLLVFSVTVQAGPILMLEGPSSDQLAPYTFPPPYEGNTHVVTEQPFPSCHSRLAAEPCAVSDSTVTTVPTSGPPPSVVPEPVPLALLGLGFGLMFVQRARRR
jgi:hypothetical protein